MGEVLGVMTDRQHLIFHQGEELRRLDERMGIAETWFHRRALLPGDENAAKDVFRITVRIRVVLFDRDCKGATIEPLGKDRGISERICLSPLADHKSCSGRRYACIDEHVETVPNVGAQWRQNLFGFPELGAFTAIAIVGAVFTGAALGMPGKGQHVILRIPRHANA
ncbi:hypothetical protein AS026_12025 [Rhizobium altiplani]|uniref:Uncharacterized protein n=1 Tax=Rhizobium altiplani TaxID=1864509 RepID=A0A120FJ59_9HYPH|nr:hypothetical protein AS026_20155 [Rhizobium altiplani]KWV48587.1 hypothetical protein AS026_12025 [Rhizobium altiplani]